MLEIDQSDIIRRIRTENPWWQPGQDIGPELKQMRHRAYFRLLMPLLLDSKVRRAVVLMGPRRVGKTVLIHHAIQSLIDSGICPQKIAYIAVDHPIYNGLSLEKLLEQFALASGSALRDGTLYVFFDEIQYLRNWENHLKVAIDTYPNIRFVASGSAAAALRLKSQESGAGRFTDFLLPPLTFHEYIDLIGKSDMVRPPDENAQRRRIFTTTDIEALNTEFIRYLNIGGYPEVIFSTQIQNNLGRFIKSDIVDKVLLRDLPSLYGIGDIQELNYLFTSLAFNTANELSLQELALNSGVAKNTIKRYVEYLEAAFLIRVLHRVDHSAKRFHRANFFKIYLTNPSMRAALFSPAEPADEVIGRLAETAILAQWFHSDTSLHYARWDSGKERGEVDLVRLTPNTQKVDWAVEVKWSDRFCDNPAELNSALSFCRKNKIEQILVTSKTKTATCVEQNIEISFVPASLYCYSVGYNLIHAKDR